MKKSKPFVHKWIKRYQELTVNDLPERDVTFFDPMFESSLATIMRKEC